LPTPSSCCVELVDALRADGHNIDHVDVGGGLGVPYKTDNTPPPLPDAYAEIVKDQLRELGCKIIMEPGRLIVGNAGIMVTEVIYVKDGGSKTFVIVDGAMNDLIRPTLYEAYHDDPAGAHIRPPTRRASRPISSARSARPVIIWRSTAKWPCRSPVT
jgi:diaminopimelate decarboxylase